MRLHASLTILLAAVLTAASGCTAPTEDPAPVEVTPATGEVDPATFIQLKFPDFEPLSYDGIDGCWDSVTNKAIYRFVVSNKGTATGTIPMIKVDIHAPFFNPSPKVQDGSIYYFWNVTLAPGEQKVLIVDLGFHPYDIAYDVTTTIDPANTIPELSKANNVMVSKETWNYMPYGTHRYCD